MADVPMPRAILRAELIAIGTELTVGETLDTNSGELARSLVAHGVTVLRVANLPDDQAVVVAALRDALARADLVVTTGGLGPTPDDLTRESVAELCGEAVVVDAPTLDWLRDLWARRRQPFPEVNTKQAWRIPSATMLPNPNGTAPGWWVDRPDGALIVTLPGPPREMRPMWEDEVLPRLAARGVGADIEVRTLRLTGIGESVVAERLGDALLRADNPSVATYARQEAVDVRISARAADGRAAAAIADEAEALVRMPWASTSGGTAPRPGRRRCRTRSGHAAGRWPRRSAAPTARSSSCCAPCRRSCSRSGARRPRTTARTRATTRGDLAEAERVRRSRAPTWGWRSARGRAAMTRSSTSRSRRPRARTPSGGSRSCAGARARTGRRSPVRRPCWRRSGPRLRAG